MVDNHPNYFDITDPNLGDTLILTKHTRFPEVTKQLTSRSDFNQLQYGTIELEIGLLNKEKSRAGRSIIDFFDSFFNDDNSYPERKMLVILDSGKTRSAWFVYYPSTFDFSYARKSDGFKLTLMARDAMCEWKELAETMLLPYHFQPNTSFKDFLKNQVMNYFYMYFQNDVDPAAITGANCILNRWLHVWCLAGGQNQHYTRYNIIKGLAVEWGLVYKFEVPADYESQALGGRVALTFRLMRRVNGNTAVMKPQDYYRTQLPRIDKKYILLVNRKYNLSFSIDGDNVNAEIVHGLLIATNVTYNLDEYNMYGQGRHGFPNTCFIMSANSSNNPNSFNEYYANKIIVRENDADVLKLNPNDVKIVENELFSLNLFDGVGLVYSIKFGNSNIYKDYPTIRRNNSRISATRLFCSSVEDNNPDFGVNDVMYLLNNLPKNELKVYFKNTGSVKGRTGILRNEPDMFDTFIVPYKGVNEVHSIISIAPNYNINDSDSSMTAEYQTVRIE